MITMQVELTQILYLALFDRIVAGNMKPFLFFLPTTFKELMIKQIRSMTFVIFLVCFLRTRGKQWKQKHRVNLLFFDFSILCIHHV